VRQGIASELHDARLRLERRPELPATGTGWWAFAALGLGGLVGPVARAARLAAAQRRGVTEGRDGGGRGG
jgi:LPXTG-motif cell wall-anchored protein